SEKKRARRKSAGRALRALQGIQKLIKPEINFDGNHNRDRGLSVFHLRLEPVFANRIERLLIEAHAQRPDHASIWIKHTPGYLARRASSENSASTLLSATGADMPPPTR